MDLETLALEVSATAAGLDVVKPAVLKGRSGVNHRFSFLASGNNHNFTFDFHEHVGDVEVLRCYIKAFDTGATAQIVCLGEKPTDRTVSLAAEYDLRIVSPDALNTIFAQRTVESRSS